MKHLKILFALTASLLLLGACNKESLDKEKLVTFTVGYRLVDNNSMYATKAVANEEILYAIQQSLPSSVALVFRSSTGVQTAVTTGVETTLSAGTYTVTGISYGSQLGDLVNTNCYFTDKPYVIFEDTITITEGVTRYTVSGSFKSFAIVVDYDEISSATYKNISSVSKEVPFQRFDNLGLIFAQGDYSQVPLQITLIPLDPSRYQETSFGFSTKSTTQKYTYVESGKYYKLHPASAGASGPIIGVGFPEFVEGTVKTD